MKTTRFLLVMIVGTGLLQGTGFAQQSNSASQQTPSQSRETFASDSSDGQKDGQIRRAGIPHGERSAERGTRHVRQRRPKQSHPKPAPSHQLHSDKTRAASNPRTEMPENGKGFQQRGSTASTGIPNRVVNHRSVPVPAPTVAINGQQFRNSRDPGARMATSGGPTSSTRATGAINGSAIKRKP